MNTTSPTSDHDYDPVVELRQYTCKPGRRDDLIRLFERYFLEGQEQYGMRVLGQFRRYDQPDQFVWLRGFAGMEERRLALGGLYDGPLWQAHRAEANDTMLDSDNVLLLKPVRPTSSLQVDTRRAPVTTKGERQGGIVIATIYSFDSPIDVDSPFVEFFETEMAPAISAAGATLRGYYVTEPAKNNFPRLPVREGEHVFVWFASVASEADYAHYRATLTADPSWNRSLAPSLANRISRPEALLELSPAGRSLFRHASFESTDVTR